MKAEGQTKRKEKLWTSNFILLFQGHLISLLGDYVYEIALGFWVLAATGSTALMGGLMASTTLPRVLISPIAGVLVDRVDRKRLLVVADFIRGICILFVAIAALGGHLSIWMVFAAGMVLGACIAFFSPAVNSSIPDIVPPTKLVSANSIIGAVYAGSNVIGSGAGGFIFQILGAPVMFLFNAITYLISGFINIFIKIPKIEKQHDQHFLLDLREGYVFIWKLRGLRTLLLAVAVLNFFSFIAIVLMIPLFQKTPALGPVRYGITMAGLTIGMLLGMVFTSTVKIPPAKRLTVFMISAVILSVGFANFALTEIYPMMLGIAVLGGFCMSIINVYVNTTIQQTVPQNMRGKVFSLVQMISTGLTPISMALGGVLGEFFPLRSIIFVCFVCIFFAFLPMGLSKSFKRFINFDADRETLEEIM